MTEKNEYSAKKILFVCTGNTCRSPMAAALCRSLAEKRNIAVVCDSAGLSAAEGMPASANAVKALQESGIDLSGHRSKNITRTLCEQADLIQPMTDDHYHMLSAVGIPPKKLLAPFNVPDPYGGDLSLYRLCRDRLLLSLQRLPLLAEISPAAQEDLDAVFALEQICFSHPWTRQGLEDELAGKNTVFLTAHCDGALIGYGSVKCLCGTGYINNIAVHEKARRQGVGRRILRGLIDRSTACGAPELTLEVRAGNTGAISLYESEGFLPVGRRKDFYRDPLEDGLILTRPAE